MTHNISASLIGGHERTAYTVEHRGNCVLITGAVPMSKFGVIAMLAPENSVVDPDTARVLGVTFAMGPADELQELRKAGAENALRHERASNPGLSEAAVKWLAGGERGTSSEAIFSHLTGVDATGMGGFDTPYDPDDFRRCRLLLEQVPELQPLLPGMRSVSPAWYCLVDAWDNICATMDAEAPNWRTTGGKTPKTYALIKTAISY